MISIFGLHVPLILLDVEFIFIKLIAAKLFPLFSVPDFVLEHYGLAAWQEQIFTHLGLLTKWQCFLFSHTALQMVLIRGNKPRDSFLHLE